jgi:hypothetical protein
VGALPLPHPLSHPRRERGGRRGDRGEGVFPTAYAMGYDLSPLAGLEDNRLRVTNFIRELLTQDSSRLVRIFL